MVDGHVPDAVAVDADRIGQAGCSPTVGGRADEEGPLLPPVSTGVAVARTTVRIMKSTGFITNRVVP